MAHVTENAPTLADRWFTVDFDGTSGNKAQAIAAAGIPAIGDPSNSVCVRHEVTEVKPGERYTVACVYGDDSGIGSAP